MENNKLLLSMMAGTCLFLLVGIIFTVVEIMGYTGEQAVASVPAGAGGAPAGQTTEQEGTGAAPQTQRGPLMQRAPQDAVAVVTVNFERLRASGLMQQMGGTGQMLTQQFPVSSDQAQRMVVFFTRNPQNPAEPATMLALRHSGQTSEIKQKLQQQGFSPTQVQGMEAYQGGDQAFVTMPDDQTVLVAQTKEMLGSIASFYQDGSGPVGELMQQTGSAVKFEGTVWEGLRAQIQQDQSAPAFVKNVTSHAGELDLSQQGLNASAELTMSDAQQATQAVDEINKGLDNLKNQITQGMNQPQTQQMGQMFTGLLDKIQVSAQGSKVTISASFTQQEMQQLTQFVMMAMMSAMQAAQQQGGGGFGPGGPGGPGMR